MKKLSKFIYFMFAFALITCMSIFNPAITSVSADTDLDVSKVFSISSEKIANTVDAANGEKLIIPMPTVSGVSSSATSHIIVKDRSGKTYTYNCKTGKTFNEKDEDVTDLDYFKLLSDKTGTETAVADDVKYIEVATVGKGTYSVQYKVVDGDKTYYSDAKSIQVKSVAYSWEFNAKDEAKNIIPSITNADSEYVLPLPKINKTNDANNPIEFTASDLGTAITITRGGADVATGANAVARIDGENIIFAPTLDAGENTTYTIKYNAAAKGAIAFPDKTFTVKVDKDYNAEAKLEVTHNAITNYQVGAVTTFPTANVTDKTHNKSNVEVNNYITIKKGGEVVAELKANEYTYTFANSGTYTITYKAVDAYGNEATSSATSITVSDKKPYLVTYASNYETTGTDWEAGVNTDVAHTIPSEVGYAGFNVPAIYAKDYVDSYEDLEFSRILRSTADSSVYFDIDSNDAVHGNASYAENHSANLSYNNVVKFSFPETTEKKASDYAGMTFKLEYSVKDKNSHNSEATATSYTIKIADVDVLTNNVDKNLVINFPTINKAIDPNAELTFTTATAKEEPTNSELVADERVEVRTFYYYGAKTEIETLLSNYITEVSAGKADYIEKYGYIFTDFESKFNTALSVTELMSNDGKTSLNLTGYTNQEKVTIFAAAINDQNQFVIKAQEVAINNTNESVAPIISKVSFATGKSYTEQLNGVSKFNQNYEVFLPSVTFTDAIDKSLQVDIKCYVDDVDQVVGVTIDEFIQKTTGECGIKTAKLTTTYAGTYYVVYTATDDAGNKVSYVSTFDVAKTEKAYIQVENGSNISKNVGEEVALNINLAGNGEYEDVEIDVKWGENKPSGLGSLPNSYKFDKAGTYVATISAKYTMNGVPYTDTPSVTVTITVTEPKMTWEDEISEVLSNRNANINDTIELPVISATENGVEINAVPKVVFIDKNDKETEIEVKLNEDSFNNYYFKAEKDGVYKVTYTATTAYNSESKSFTVTCGDYYDPTINVESNKLEGSQITYNGKDIILSVESFNHQKDEHDNNITGKYILKVVAKEDGSSKNIFSYDIKVDLKDTDADKAIALFTPNSSSFDVTGASVEDYGSSNRSWRIKGVGDYELKLTVEDENGNTTTKSISFKLINKTQPKSIKDEVVGIVLIIVSVVCLGGVILFFALAGKRNKTKRKTVKSENKD